MSTTREILGIMRSASGPNVNGVRLSRAYGRRRYFLSVGDNQTYVGHVAMYDATKRELWTRPADEPHRDVDMINAVRPALVALQAVQTMHGTPRTHLGTSAPERLPYVIA